MNMTLSSFSFYPNYFNSNYSKIDSDTPILSQLLMIPIIDGLNKKILILLSKTQKICIMFLMMRYMLLPSLIIICIYYLIGGYFAFNMIYIVYILCKQPLVPIIF